MRKQYRFIFLLLFLSACGMSETHSAEMAESAKEFGEEFVKNVYTIDDFESYDNMNVEALLEMQDEYRSFFTEEEFESLAAKRFFLIPLEAAAKQQNTISVKDLIYEQKNDENETNTFDFDHSFTLIFKDSKGNIVDKIEINGQMTLIHTDKGWKMDRYYDSEIPAEMIYPS